MTQLKKSIYGIRIVRSLQTLFVSAFVLSPLHAEPDEEKTVKGDFAKGAKLWSEQCGHCHNIRDPKDFDSNEWVPILLHMRVRTPLSGQEYRDVLEFMKASN